MQLLCKIAGLVDYSKASKMLFRCLYSKDEIKGRSLTGVQANKTFTAQPSLEDPSKLGVIYGNKFFNKCKVTCRYVNFRDVEID